MQLESLRRCVRARTQVALVRLDVVVLNEDVVLQAARLAERLATLAAAVAPLVGVHPAVRLEVPRRPEPAPALDAEVPALGRVDAPVLGEVVLPAELAAAVGALEVRLGVEAHVFVERREHPAANGAEARAVAGGRAPTSTTSTATTNADSAGLGNFRTLRTVHHIGDG